MRKVVSRLCIILIIVTMTVGVLAACGKKDLSGEYTIEEFAKLMAPANEIDANIDQLREIGFEPGQTFTVTGGKYIASVNGIYGLHVVISTPNGDSSIMVVCDLDEYGWLHLCQYLDSIDVRFKVSELEYDGKKNLQFYPTEVLSMTAPTYVPDCSRTSGDGTVMGEVVDIRSTSDFEEVFMDAFWTSALMYATQAVILQDDAGNQILAFLNTENSGDVKIGDHVGCTGNVHDTPQDVQDVPEQFIDTSIYQAHYIFE